MGCDGVPQNITRNKRAHPTVNRANDASLWWPEKMTQEKHALSELQIMRIYHILVRMNVFLQFPLWHCADPVEPLKILIAGFIVWFLILIKIHGATR